MGTFIAGISGSSVSGPDVVVNGSGKLGVVVSSARYKKDIKDMGSSTDALAKLRPVTFKYKNDEQGITQYGLVAEEVEKVYPELVTYGSDGKIETVRYSMLTSMLLNEVQKQSRENRRLITELGSTRREVAELKAEHQRDAAMQARFERRLAVMERTLAETNRDVATTAFNR